MVSDRDRHLFMFGTETTIGTGSTQDKLFIRFSDQENISDYAPTSVNTAGSFRLDSGTKIVGAVKGKDYTFVLTDNNFSNLVVDFLFRIETSKILTIPPNVFIISGYDGQ